MEVFACGWAAGAAGVLISHPLDTLRVLVQTDTQTLPEAAGRLWAKEGVFGFFKGLLSPLLAVGLWKAVMFSSSVKTINYLGSTTEKGEVAPVWHSFAGGYMAGLTGLSVQTPFERVKIEAQTSPPPPGKSVVAHEIGIMQRVWRTEGVLGLYRGTLINTTLCPPAIGVWFGTNEFLVRQIKARGREVGVLDEFACGSFAGTLAWAVNFPSDKAKAIVQAEAGRSPGLSDIELLRPHVRAQGASFFWRGISATLLRSIPQTGATIVAFTECSKLFKRWREGA